MSKWYEAISEEPSNIIYSRIRLARNWNEYVFPSRLDEAGSRELVDGLRDGLKDIGEKTGTPLFYRPLETMAQAEKKALRERRILNRCAVEKTCAQGLYLSEDESESILLGADDHIRLQQYLRGLLQLRYRPPGSEFGRAEKLRRMVVDNYSVFYVIQEESVIVTNVLYSASDIEYRLKK